MVTTTAWIERQRNPQVVSGFATIDINETASLAIPCGGRALIRLGIPSSFTGTTLTFTVQPFPPADPAAPTADPPFRQLRDAAGNVVTATVAANRTLDIPELAGAYAFTIVSGSSEAAARAIEVQCVGPYPSSPGVNNVTIEGSTTVTANQGTAGAAAWLVYDVPQSGTTANASQAGSTIEEDSLVVKASAGNLYGFVASSTVAGFIQLHNSASLPANTAVPYQGNSYAIAAGGTITLNFDPPLRLSTGIVLANSTTQNALTVATGDDTLFGAQYV